MQITDDRIDQDSLAALGTEAVQLLCSGSISVLADRFGYALAFGREPTAAIREELASCLAQLRATGLAPPAGRPAVAVRYLEPNDSGLFALVECLAPTNNGSELLVELAVTTKGSEKHVGLEQLSVAA